MKDAANLVAKILAATMGGDEEMLENLLDQFHKNTTPQQRVALYRENIMLYPIADEFGLATEMVEGALESLEEQAQADPALQALMSKVGLVYGLMDEILGELDEMTEAALTAYRLPID
jgi:hypothetical protein